MVKKGDMMKKIVHEFDTCLRCPFCYYIISDNESVCKIRNNKHVMIGWSDIGIPNWCPLEDVKSELSVSDVHERLLDIHYSSSHEEMTWLIGQLLAEIQEAEEIE